MFEIGVIATCLLVNALLAGVEIGFVSASKPQRRYLARGGSTEAQRILEPAVNVLEWSTKMVIRVFFKKARPAAPLPETTVEIDALGSHHQQAVLNLAHLERRQIGDILVPWGDVVLVRAADSMEAVVPVVFASGHARLPVEDNGSRAS